jgi:hypothetical protein
MATDILIESTASFENDITHLTADDQAIVTQQINELAILFPRNPADVYSKLRQPPAKSSFDEYESSLYILSISAKNNLVLAIDEDPIFGQVVFTLFRVFPSTEVDRVYHAVSESLYQDMVHLQREVVQI